jgi:hypothetical protein
VLAPAAFDAASFLGPPLESLEFPVSLRSGHVFPWLSSLPALSGGGCPAQRHSDTRAHNHAGCA